MFVIGIDPGLKGGIAVIAHDSFKGMARCEILALHPMPLTKDESIDGRVISNLISTSQIRNVGTDHIPVFGGVVIEKTLALPGQAVKAAYSQGYNLGVVHAAIESTGNKPIEVAPITWTTWLHKYARRTKDSKKDTWNALQAILPEKDLALVPRTPRSKVPHDGIVDAIGIALWWAVEGHKR